MLRNVEPLRNLVGAEVLVKEEQNFDLSGRKQSSDRLGDSVKLASLSNPVEESTRDASRECGVASRNTPEERRNLLGGLGLEEVTGRPRTDRCEQVLLGVGRGEHDDLARRCVLADSR